MAPFRPDPPRSNLVLRLCSAGLLAPPLAAAIHFGSVWYETLLAAAAAVMTWEWYRLCLGSERSAAALGVMGSSMAAVLGLAILLEEPAAALAAACLGALGAAFCRSWHRESGSALLLSAGTAMIGAFAVSWLWLRGLHDGRFVVFWLILTVCSTDIGAYVTGKIVGGPRLAPRISPGKTWAGFVGGMSAAVVCSALWNSQEGGQGLVAGVAGGVAVGLLAQIGDLLVSAVKRRSKVKDTGNLIPGHGGLLDRTDSLLLSGPFMALFLIYSRQT